MASERWIDLAIGAMSLDEKASLLAGQDFWTTVPLEAHGIASMRMTDGPNGARGSGSLDAPSTSFPVGTALAATWNVPLVEQVGVALAEEAKAKGAQLLLGPTVNLHRSPLAGRNFECFSEDPHLSATLAVAYIRGLQGNGVGACIKHYVANDSEFERMTISSEVDERTLRELYLVPFERAVAEAEPWAVMGAYNRVNGTYACAHRRLLVEVLKDEWGFSGAVISDWGALHDTEGPANGGCDLEMPGPARFFGPALADAVRSGAVPEDEVDDKVRRVVRLVARAGRAMADPAELPGPLPAEEGVDRDDHRALTRRVAADAMVLLRNRTVAPGGVRALPLEPGPALTRLAVIGPNARSGTFQGGGSSVVIPPSVSHPLEAVRARAAQDRIVVVHEPGGNHDRYVPEPDPAWFVVPGGHDRGLRLDYVDGGDATGPSAGGRVVPSVSFTWWRAPSAVGHEDGFSARWCGRFVAPVAGPWRIGLLATGVAEVLIDGRPVATTASPDGSWFFGRGGPEATAVVTLAGPSHELEVRFTRDADSGPAAIRLGLSPAPVGDPIDAAVAAAASCDAAVVVVGTTGEWEGEGADRVDMRLPNRQDELIERVAAVNPRTVVVVNTGSPVEMPWADSVPAIVQAWFGGQELGHALADVLFGDVDPGGRLPTSFPLRYEDHPALFGYPGENGEVRYGEGVFVGYRAYATRGQAVRFPFGHGHSYTTFAYEDLHVLPAGDGESDGPSRSPAVAEVRVDVVNTGDRTGHEVTQLYVRPPAGRLPRPALELKAFAKTTLAPGERRTLHLSLDARDFAAFDTSLPGWRAEAGDYELLVGSSSVDGMAVPFTLPATIELRVAGG